MSYVIFSNRTRCNSPLKQSPEHKTAALRCTPVKSERELLKIGLKVFRNYRPLVCAKNPEF